MSNHLLIEFDRLGRGGRKPAFEIAEASEEAMELELIRLIRKGKYLASREFDVIVNLEEGRVLVDGGRFGTGRISRINVEPIG